MNDLLTLLREHDLPVAWDGLATVWDGWHKPAPAFVCPPQPSSCESCGSMVTAVHNRGRVARLPVFTVAMILANDETRARLPVALRHKVRPRALVRLLAFRCPDCQLDVVHDLDTGETWTLDHTDYGPDGSVHP